jgi:hypothetical protein
MKVKTLSSKLEKYITQHGLTNKFKKQLELLKENPNHPSLNTEKLSPKTAGLYSFFPKDQFVIIKAHMVSNFG